ncbi:hypothetical protein B566_EDAN011970 [Ephemera danica]|nr:hypothetical protein B566_EDAN011970 [Ephemera danica]
MIQIGTVPASAKSCSSSEFKCANGKRCIGAAQKCDGINDCEDKSDESTCKQRCISRGLQSCPDTPDVCYNASSSPCARLSQCPVPAKQGKWLPCKDERSCYHEEQLCDNNFDCGDQSDEANCPASTTSSASEPSVFFMCDNWKWVSSSKVCDGNDDCGDNSDEEGCVRPSLETAIILGCLSCSLLFILLASYTFHAHNHHQRRSQQTESTPRIRPLLSSHPYIMPFREPPPPYPMDPPPRSRRYRRHRRHSRLPSSQVTNPPTSVPLDEQYASRVNLLMNLRALLFTSKSSSMSSSWYLAIMYVDAAFAANIRAPTNPSD